MPPGWPPGAGSVSSFSSTTMVIVGRVSPLLSSSTILYSPVSSRTWLKVEPGWSGPELKSAPGPLVFVTLCSTSSLLVQMTWV